MLFASPARLGVFVTFFLALGSSWWPGRAGAAAPRPERPNVVLVMTDDQGYGDVAAHGTPEIKTPNLDRLHAQSVRLTDFHVDPTCSPTRSALMTGRYSGRVGVWHTIMGRSLLRAGEVTMADVFSEAGYATGIFGKWHLGDNYPFRPQYRGFHEVFIHGGGGVGQTPDYWGNDYFDDTYFHNGKPEKQTGYCTDVWFGGAMRFIEANRDRPFFAYIPTNAPHGPYHVPEKYIDMYRGKPGVPNANFWGMITNIDENMGRLMEQLKRLGLEENTVLIFMTDNGTSGGSSAGMRGKKGSQYDGGHRVPCFIRWPGAGISGGHDVPQLAAHLDLLPTLIELCGLEAPAGVKFDGTSLAPLLTGIVQGWPDRILVVESQRIEHPEKWRQSAVMTDRWRLVNGKELYDMPADPGQKNDVAAEHPEVVKELVDFYNKWWEDVSARHGEYCRTVLGANEENPTTLTCHDWHEVFPPWNQSHIRAGMKANGFWAVEVAEDGQYEIELRRWPKEAGQKPINEGPGVRATEARLTIGGVDQTQPVADRAVGVTLRVELKAGPTRLQTWLSDEEGNARGAYYAYVRRLDR